MNCRTLTVRPLAFVFLVIAMQAAGAGEPTTRSATVTATILNAATNEVSTIKDRQGNAPRQTSARELLVKYIGVDGHITTADTEYARILIIKDLR